MTDVEKLVLTWTDALVRGDAEEAAACFTENGVWHDMGFGLHCEGRAALAATWAAGLLSELEIVKTAFVVQGATFACEWTMSGVHSGPAPGVPATGKPFRVAGASVGHVFDDHLARVVEYWNLAEFLKQVGAL